MHPDALYTFQDNEVPQEVQAKLAYAGFASISKLRGLGDNRGNIKTMMIDHFGIDPATSLANLSIVASVQAAWEASKVYIERKAAVEAEEKINGTPRAIKGAEYTRIKNAHEKLWGPIPKNEVPSKALCERIVHENGEGEYIADP